MYIANTSVLRFQGHYGRDNVGVLSKDLELSIIIRDWHKIVDLNFSDLKNWRIEQTNG